jgi:hypothetical protein
MFHVKQEQSGRRGGAAGASVSRLKFTSWCGPHYTSWCATTPKPLGSGTPGSCPDPRAQSKPGRLAKLDSCASMRDKRAGGVLPNGIAALQTLCVFGSARPCRLRRWVSFQMTPIVAVGSHDMSTLNGPGVRDRTVEIRQRRLATFSAYSIGLVRMVHGLQEGGDHNDGSWRSKFQTLGCFT